MKKLMCALAAVAAGVTFAEETPGITSANIVGYRHTEIPTGYSFFTPQFKDCVNGKMNIDDLIPKLTNGVALTKPNHVQITIFSDPARDAGTYSEAYSWVPGTGWTIKGEKHTDTVEFLPGDAVAIWQDVRVNASETADSTTGTRYRPIHLFHSGEVIFQDQKVVPTGYSFGGNTSYETINLDQLVPTLTNGVALTKPNHVQITIFSDPARDAGTYSEAYSWVPGTGWTIKGEKHTDTVLFKPGEGYAIWQDVRVNAAETADSTTGTRYRPILLTVTPADK